MTHAGHTYVHIDYFNCFKFPFHNDGSAHKTSWYTLPVGGWMPISCLDYRWVAVTLPTAGRGGWVEGTPLHEGFGHFCIVMRTSMP